MRKLVAVLCVFAIAGVANAQSLNVDFETSFGVPTDAYGAGAGQPGFWNSFDGSGAPHDLLDLGGGATDASVLVTMGGSFGFDNPGTSGDDQALMDDVLDLGGVGGATQVLFSGLLPGDYEVYTYAWAPDSDAFLTNVGVLGSGDPLQAIGGFWPGAQEQGTTYALHTVNVDGSGTLQIDASTLEGFGSLNGVQLVIPEPASLALLSLGGLTLLRRRRLL